MPKRKNKNNDNTVNNGNIKENAENLNNDTQTTSAVKSDDKNKSNIDLNSSLDKLVKKNTNTSAKKNDKSDKNNNQPTKVKRTISMMTIDKKLEELEKGLTIEKNNIIHLLQGVKDVRKDYSRYMKELSKKRNKVKTNVNDTKAVNNDLKMELVKLDESLCNFLEIDTNSSMSSSDVFKKINEYIVSNSLQDESNATIIKLDDKLKDLLQPKKRQQVTYFNIQHFLSKHYTTV